MIGNRYRKVTFYNFKLFICVCIMTYTLLVHTVSAQKTFGEICNSSQECTPNLNCVSGNCECVGDFYYNSSSGSCFLKKTFGEICNSSQECTSNLNCVSGNCECVGDFYYNSSSRSCFLRKRFEEICSSSKECTSNLFCVSGNCECVNDFYYNSSSSSCLLRTFGETCSSSKECTSNLFCVSGNCDCVDDFYYNSSSRSCFLKNNLKINPTYITRGTRTVTFVWREMSQTSDASFSIRWNGSNKMNATKTGVTVTDLVPGTLYNFSVVTSLPADGNYPPITVEQQQAPLWTRPDRPGPVSEVRREADSYYEIRFGYPTGRVDHYTMSVSSEVFLIETQSSTSPVMYFTQLKADRSYRYILNSYSGNSEESDPETGYFATAPEGDHSVPVREVDMTLVWFIVGGFCIVCGLALNAVCGGILFLIRQALCRRGLREPIRKNPHTQVTSRDKHTPQITFSRHIELPQLPANSHIYNEIHDYNYITAGSSVSYSRPHTSPANNVR